MPECQYCKGLGGFDDSKNCEEYDDWRECLYCEGTGEDKYHEDEIFVAERDAFTPND
jgi:hypothetical protein